jgi:hypothetical protein
MKQKTGIIIINDIDLKTYLKAKYNLNNSFEDFYTSGEQVYTFQIYKNEVN